MLPGQEAGSLKFQRIPNELGLSQGLISALCEDSRGFLWVGTKDGLNLFDGYRFKVFRMNAFDSTSLSDNYIKSIFEDRQGRLWVGTVNGLNLFDREREIFFRMYAQDDNPNSLSHSEVNCIMQDRTGRIWVGTQGGNISILTLPLDDVLHLDKIQFDHIRQKDGLEGQPVTTIFEDKTGTIWLKTPTAVQTIRPGGKPGAYTISDFHTDEFGPTWKEKARQYRYYSRGIWPEDHRIYSIFPSLDGGVWFSTAPGFIKMNADGRETPNFYPVEGWSRNGVALLNGIRSGSGFENTDGRLWASGIEALVVFNTANGKLETGLHTSQENLPEGFYPIVSSILRGKSGVIWVGSNGNGLFKCKAGGHGFRHYPLHPLISGKNSVRSIRQLTDGTILVATATYQLLRLNPVNGKSTFVNLPLRDADRTVVYSFLERKNGELWIGAMNGLYRMQIQPDRIEMKAFFSSMEDGSQNSELVDVFGMQEDPAGNLWLITNNSIGKFNPNTGMFQGNAYLDEKFSLQNANNFPCMYQDRHGDFWIGCVDGLKRYEPEKDQFQTFRNEPSNRFSLSHNVVRSILPDPKEPDRFLWIGTAGGGLNRFDISKGTFEHFTIENGLPDNVIYGILADDAGNLWMSTNQGLSRFRPDTGTFLNFDISNGLQDNEFNSLAYFKGKNGVLFFGGVNGLNAFSPKEVRENNYQAPVVFTDFQLFNRTVDFKAPNAPISKSIAEEKHIVLDHNENVFSIEFAALDFSNPAKNQYAYLLENFNKDWQYIGSKRSVTFTNLNPGKYVFRVKGSNSDGVWSDKEATVEIQILRPWWSRWWAVSIYLLVLALGLFAFHRFNMRRIVAQEEARSFRELDKLKNRLYTNITHEFRSPLTIIKGLAEEIKGNDTAKELISRNADNLLKLINQILDLSKLESGNMKLDLQGGNIIYHLRQITESFQPIAAAKKISLTFYPATPELFMDFDEEKIRLIVYNLLSNALKFTDEGGKVIFFVRQIMLHGKPFLQINLKDTGIGIAAEELPHIFDRFYQSQGSGSRRNEGSGIGLAITRELVKLMGGEIAVTSELGKGTAFTVSLPIGMRQQNQKHSSDQAVPAEMNAKETPVPFFNHSSEFPPKPSVTPLPGEASDNPLLLLVEDNADVVTMMMSMLKEEYILETANNGREGIEKAKELIPDIIISDVMMPDVDGLELCKTLKKDERTSHIPIILLTARATQEDKISGLEAGADAYLLKPFDKKELYVRLEKLLELRQSMQEYYSQSVFKNPETQSLAPAPLAAAREESLPDDRFLKKFQTIVESKMDDPDLSIADLSREVRLSHTQLYRKLKALTGLSPVQFLRQQRLSRAVALLNSTSMNISEVAYSIGFNDPNYFSRIFHEEFGFPPSEIRKEE